MQGTLVERQSCMLSGGWACCADILPARQLSPGLGACGGEQGQITRATHVYVARCQAAILGA